VTTSAIQTPPPDAFDADTVFERIRQRIAPTLAVDALDANVTPLQGDHLMNHWTVTPDFLGTTRVAAVLIGLVERADGLHVLLTQRTAHLREHSGQVAFPGGKMDPGDASPAATALREAWEEVGLPAGHGEVLGYLEPYLTRTGFRIIPVIARVTPFDLVLNTDEVVEAFEVPFAYVMSEANHQLKERVWQQQTWRFYAMVYGQRTVWGITAGILRLLYERLYL
jgi:8-oxo-dGTP pyrophosphatase MutT (NUDIX family)